MGNRCFLFVRGAGEAEDAPLLAVAEGNNLVPTLWHVLLANGGVGEPVTYQRLITPDEDPGIELPAEQALAQWERAVALLRQHPLAQALPALPRYLEAASGFFRQLVDEAGEGAVFSVDLSEIFMLDGEDAGHAVRHWQDRFNRSWAAVCAAERGEGLHRLNDWLLSDEATGPLSDWDTWRWTVGLGGLEHAYFQTPYDGTPRDEAFADFEPEPEIDDDPWAWTGWRAQPSEGGVTLVRDLDGLAAEEAEAAPSRPDAPGVWDEAVPATGWEAAWVRQGERWGLLGLGDSPGVLLAPALDEPGDIRGDEARACQGGRWGVLRQGGDWRVAPRFEGLGDLVEGRRVFVQGGRMGLLDADGQQVVPAQYDEVLDLQAGFACVAQRAAEGTDPLWGLIDREGRTLQPCVWDGLEWQDALGWEAWRDGRMAWLSPQGAQLLAPEWDEVCPQGPDLVAVRRGEAWGLWAVAAPEGALPAAARELLPCRHAGLRLLASRVPGDAQARWQWAEGWQGAPAPGLARLARSADTAEPAACLRLVAEQADGTLGVVDGAGQPIVPGVFEALQPRGELPGPARWLQGERAGAKGLSLIDLDSGRELLGGQGAAHLWAVPAQAEARYWLAVRAEGPQGQSAQVWTHDGEAWALPGCYEWLYQPMDLRSAWTAGVVTQRLHEAWQVGRPVRAAPLPGPDGLPARHQWVQPGQPPIDHETWLAQAWAAGDLEAAATLAADCLEGHGLPRDATAARRWAARACSDEAGTAPSGGPTPSPEPSVDAMRLYASLLFDGTGGPVDLPGARRWAERAAQAEAQAGTAPSLPLANLLGCVLLREEAGPVDAPRAWQLFSHAADQGDATGLFNQGVCLRDGLGVARDLQRAVTAFAAADEAGSLSAAGQAARVIDELLGTGDVPDAAEVQRLCQRVIYFCDKQLATPGEDEDDAGRAHLLGLKDAAQRRWQRLQDGVPEGAQDDGGPDDPTDKPWSWGARLAFVLLLPVLLVGALWRLWRQRRR